MSREPSLSRDVARQVASCAAALAQVALPALLPPRIDADEQPPNVIQPSAATFAVWLPIFATSLGYARYQLRPSIRTEALPRQVGWPLAAAFASTGGGRGRQADLVLGFSLGVMPAQELAQTRPGARGALLVSARACRCGYGSAWPDDVPVQVHAMDHDPYFVNGGDINAARSLVSEARNAELLLYPGDQHLFADSSLPSYDAETAGLLLERVIAFPQGVVIGLDRHCEPSGDGPWVRIVRSPCGGARAMDFVAGHRRHVVRSEPVADQLCHRV